MLNKMVVLLSVCMSFSGCCWLAKRDCFPACPPPEIVPVDKPCDLPPGPEKIVVQDTAKDCPPDYMCFDPKNAALLASKLAASRVWIEAAKTKCGAKPSATQPSTIPTNP